jgi:hypothetical protein
MAGWMGKIFAGGIGNLAEQLGGVADRFIHTKDEKAKFKLDMESLLQKAGSELEQTMRTELQSKERIMVAELTQGDNYTKRARPTVVYFGLAVIAWNYSIVPFLGAFIATPMPLMPLPAEFWYAWGGVVATWSVGRTMERRGSKNNLLTLVTGNKPTTGLTE